MSNFVLASIVLVLTYPNLAGACGRLSLQAGNISEQWSRRSDLKNEPLQVVRSDTSKSCSYFITFTSGQSHSQSRRILRHGPSEVEYQLYQSPYRNEGQILKALPGTVQSSNVIVGQFSTGSSLQDRKSYFFGILNDADPTQFPASGMYSDSFTISIYQGTLGTVMTPDDTVHVNVSLQVPKIIALSLVPTGSAFRFGDTSEYMDFGELKTGDARDFDLRVITNAGYSVTFSSTNDGVLRHVTAHVKSTVPYRLAVDSSQKNLRGSRSRPVLVARGGRQGRTQAVRKNVRVTIGGVQDQMAGRYQDVITIVATAME